jgi:FkbM family methyltransferase
MATLREILKPLVYALRSVLGVNGLASGVRELGAGLVGIEAEIRAVSARSRFVEESAFERHAQLMARFHTTQRIIPDYEHILEDDYRRLVPRGTTVIDVGAHAGRHTAVFADLVGAEGTVIAFEPLPELAMALRKKEFNCPVQIQECALSDYSGSSQFTYMRGTPGESGLRERVSNYPELADPTRIDVSVRRLDEFLPDISNLRFVKIDVEGGEIACLRGAVGLLSQFRPYVSVEYGSPSYSAYGLSARSLYDIADSIDYKIGDLFGAVCPNCTTWEHVCDLSYWDWFLVPKERVGEWQTRLRV